MTAPTQTALTVTPKNVRALLTSDAAMAVIAPYLPTGTDIERVVAAAKLALTDNPALGKCTPTSLVRAVAKIQQWGLEIGYTAHLVPFKSVCTPIADYKGLAELVRRSGAVRHVETRSVYEKEHFRIEYGLNPVLEHIPLHRKSERGPLVGAYVIFFLPYGARSFHFMGVDDIDEIRKAHSKQWASGPCPPFYAEKTVLRRGVKLLPKDARLADALRVVEDEEQTEAGDVTESHDGPVTNLGAEDRPAAVDADGVEISDDSEDALLADDRALLHAEGE